MKFGEKVGKNPWDSTTLEWTAPSPPLPHVNFEKIPEVYREAYEYSVPGRKRDFTPQTVPKKG
jgi:cytochrome c oxidase subunit 1